MAIGRNQALWASVILHLSVLLGFFLFTIVDVFRPKEKLHVFEMVEPPSSAQHSTQSAAPVELPPAFDLPDVEPLNVSDPVLPKPEPVISKPLPKPVKSKPTPKPVPAQQAPQLMSADDFFKNNPRKTPKPRKLQSAKPNFKAPTINTDKISQSLRSLTNIAVNDSSSRTLSSAERSALQRYGDQLNSRLNRAWIKPANLAGVKLGVTVVFDVSSSGRISNVRLRPASGNAAFDRSVKAAFSRVGSGGVMPTGQGHSFTMSFKMVE